MYFSYLMLRNLAPGATPAADQRAADDQLGQLAATLARARNRAAQRAHAMIAPGQPVTRGTAARRRPPVSAR
jgi:hypothetical protein